MPLQERAAHLLITPSALVQLSLDEARRVVGYMHPRSVPTGTTFMREGDVHDNDFMLLLLEGDVQIASHDLNPKGSNIVVRILGPGSLIGELGLLDGQPRSANCVALTELQSMVLHRADFMRLIEDDPRLGTRLLLAISARTADRLRELTTKFKLFVQMNKAMSAELAASADPALTTQATTRPASSPARDLDWPELP